MGTRVAPCYANIVMGVLKKKTCSPLHHRVRHLCSTGGSLTMCLAFGFSEKRPCWLFLRMQTMLIRVSTYRFGTEVDFVDSTVLIRGDSISLDLYAKPTDTHQYLLPSSDHPPHVHKHLPYGLSICLRAIVSDDTRWSIIFLS